MRTILSQLVILVLSGLLLAACTQATPTSAPTSTAAATPPTPAPIEATPTSAASAPAPQAAQQVQIVLSPDSSENLVGTEHTITATVKAAGKPVAGVTVTFTIISGPNAVYTFKAMRSPSVCLLQV